MSTLAPGSFGDAYQWTRDRVTDQLPPLPSFENPVSEGLDAGLDSVVKAALDATGLMDVLEKVTGDLQALTAAAHEWQTQAQAMREVAAELRSAGTRVDEAWDGAASAAFGAHMAVVVEAIDATAEDMAQVAQIISQAAAECQLAETLIIGIIREAIETLIITLAAGLVVDILTLGLATAAEALIVEGEIAIYIARVGQVSLKLEKALKELHEAVKAMKAARSLGTFNKARKAAKAVRKIGGRGSQRKTLWKAITDPSMENLGEFATARAVGAVYSPVKGAVKGGLGAVTGAGDFAGVLTDNLLSDQGLGTVAGALDGPPQGAPYRVPNNRIEEAFG
ncbi:MULTISPECIES: hypothetical protein [Kitasatospora]|uniref:Outer membrane channel protein CpnT-like N-terminal domain-containing protein n=1 Tax=Kitasatospora setae (strain ATCC 33774 / DSM 43861 / JCM 3304 / KCC A-0304 / NBRC 14216 / KM-6054) TaxID=452652 RepID=E4NHR6_KITSK|nr:MULTISPECIES: hypothetical protein [Kitasatospora]BAJ31046.1 hypothetical protein KSE_52700 [Kitasatospora setae KM-6054]